MEFISNQYYHIYNRTNNKELLFRTNENYGYFIKKYRYYMDEYFDTIGYCLMPTHFHLLIRVKQIDILDDDIIKNKNQSIIISRKFGTLLNSYSQSYNKAWNRNGNLFTQKTKSKHIDNEQYLLTLITYIHQNPLRAGLVERIEEWRYSSYLDYIDYRNGTLPKKEKILSNITKEEFCIFSNIRLNHISSAYWV